MPSAHEIQQLLQPHFPDATITVTDDSAKHAGHAGAPAGGGSHFTVRVVSADFAGKSRVKRHRMVYEVLTPLFAQGLHALAIEAELPSAVNLS